MSHAPCILSLTMTFALGLLAGCNSTVQGGEGGGGTGGDASAGAASPDAVTSTGSGPVSNITATTRWITPELEAELCAFSSPCDIPDASILLVIDSAGPVCGLPIHRPFGNGEGFRVALALPPELQIEGYYVLDGREGILMTQGYEHEGGATAAGGSWGIGSIEILAADDLDLKIRTTGLTDGVSTYDENGNETQPFNSDGEYVTVPCE